MGIMKEISVCEKESIRVAHEPIETIRSIGGNSLLVSHRNKAAAIYNISEDPINSPSVIMKEYRNHRQLVSDAI